MFLKLKRKTIETKYDNYKCCSSQVKAFVGPSSRKCLS